MKVLRQLALAAVLAAGAALPGKVAAQAAQKAGPDTVVFTPSRGKVVFLHGKHAKAYECSSCHHASRLQSKGFGPSKPAKPNDTPEGRQANRRVELVKI